jgi:TonB-linked SusC/RagA family outer membrane protein
LQANTAYSQKARVNLNFEDASLTDIFREIEKQTEYRFFYNNTVLNTTDKLNLKTGEKELSEVLDQIFGNTNMAYKLIDKYIVITPKNDTAIPVSLQSNRKTITGTVTDERGEAVIGANIVEKGTTNGVVTDFDGKFSIAISENDILQVSYIGYISREIQITNQSSLQIVLREDLQALDEVVVVGYGTVRKADLTGAISQIDPAKRETSFTSNATDLLRNAVAGMNIPFSTSAKGDVDTRNILIRGTNSIKASNGPLVVLDGIVWDGDLADISSTDIERIDVMKDASSAAIYGSRAANGVIQITTRKGSKGAPAVTVSTNFGFTKAYEIRKALDGSGYVNMRVNLMQAVRGNPNSVNGVNYYDNPSSLSGDALNRWMNFSNATGDVTTEWLTRLNFYPVEIENYKAGRSMDWADLIFQTGFKQDYNMNISGGSERSKYYFSLGYSDVDGFVVGDEYEAIRSRFNLETEINKYISAGVNAQFAVRNQGGVRAGTHYQQMSPFSSLYDENGVMKQHPFDNSGQDGGSNPLLDREYRSKYDKTYDLNTRIWGMLTLPFGINYTLNIVNNFTVNKNYQHDYASSPARNDGGFAYRHNSSSHAWTIENILKWNKTFGVHAFDVTLMQNAERYSSWYDSMENSGFDPTDLLGYHAMGLGGNAKISSNDETDTRNALLARLNYVFDNRYYLTAAVRRDGYSAFGQDNPYATFPTMALGWRISEESFFKTGWIDNLKIRVSWGANGNSAIGRYDALATMNNIKILQAYAASGAYYTQSGLALGRLANAGLQWEKTTATNFGVDFNLFGNRLNGTVEYYISKTTNLLLDRELPSIVGVKNVAANLGQVNNNGWEVTLNSLNTDIKNKLQWNTNLSLSGYRNRIVHLYGDYDENGVEQDDTRNGWYIGHAIDAIYDYKPDGIWQTDELEAARKQGKAYAGYFPGDYKMVDVNNDGEYRPEDDRQFLGHKNPHFFFNLINDFTLFNDFSLSFTLYGATGGKRNYNNEHFGALTISDFDIPYWTEENRSNKYPRMSERDIDAVPTTNYIRTDFIRLSNIALGYNLPSKLLSHIGLSSVKVFCNAENVAVWSPWPVWDPENTGSPVPRKFNFGFNLKF